LFLGDYSQWKGFHTIFSSFCQSLPVVSPADRCQLSEDIAFFRGKGKGNHEKPIGIDGLRNAQWIALDYSDVMVHIFLPEVRDFYHLENLWADAKLTEIPNID
jgi:ribosome-associated protein